MHAAAWPAGDVWTLREAAERGAVDLYRLAETLGRSPGAIRAKLEREGLLRQVALTTRKQGKWSANQRAAAKPPPQLLPLGVKLPAGTVAPRTCQYPVEPSNATGGWKLCGAPVRAGCPYCAPHARICYLEPRK